MKVVVDIDGTLNDFVNGFINYNELAHPSPSFWEQNYEIEKIVGAPKLSTMPVDFWATLGISDVFAEIMFRVATLPFTLCCTRYGSVIEMQGKVQWVVKNGIPCRLFGVHKEYYESKADYFRWLGDEDALLIDDSDHEISCWQGPRILVPRPYNMLRGEDPVAVVVEQMEALGLSIDNRTDYEIHQEWKNKNAR